MYKAKRKFLGFVFLLLSSACASAAEIYVDTGDSRVATVFIDGAIVAGDFEKMH